MISTDPDKEELSLSSISENHLLRYLCGKHWDVKEALEHLKVTERWTIVNSIRELRGGEDFPNIVAMKSAGICKRDKAGRQNLSVELSRFIVA
jgi:hypothetical protein